VLSHRSFKYRLQMNALFCSLIMLLFSGCSTNIDLGGGYTIYDTGGSNQTLIGNNGMTSVHDVTGYLESNSYILVESNSSKKRAACEYVLVSKRNGKKFILSINEIRNLRFDHLMRTDGVIVIPAKSCSSSL
jgi:hypothetical protein